MMEGLHVLKGQEDYIWAMRTAGLSDLESDQQWRSRKSWTMMDKREIDKGETRSLTKATVDNDDKRKARVLASLVPDEVILNVNNYSHRHYEACLLFGDVSGFTDLCEKYNRTGKSGPSRMTQVLNSYIGSMVQEVLSHEGDVLKFSGDAFLAIWKCRRNQPMRDVVHMALDCALAIQKSHGMYETDVGVIIRVKLAISAGHVIFALIGDSRSSHYVVVGEPIWDVNAAESKSVAGEIIVAPTAWNHVNPTEYLSEEMGDKLHVKVHGIGPNWRSVQKSNQYQDGIDQETTGDEKLKKRHKQPNTANDYSLRPVVDIAANTKMKENLRRFIIPPVMRGIDLDEPLEYLTEMRQVVIMFINVVSHKIDLAETVNLTDKCYKTVCDVVEDMKGCVNKVSLFDKDMMFVAIFGLRGFKHDLESQVALKCASECHQAISNFKEVKSASIGVTTGMTYCGVFGHTMRREYTVISLIVNKAARLMMAYPYKVTCDRETFLHSKLEAKNFILQEHKELKGIVSPGPIYQFKETITQGTAQVISHFPLLGRDDEIVLYQRMVHNLSDISRLKKTTIAKLIHHNMLVFQGDARQGKTRLLNELVYITDENIPVNRFTLYTKDYKIPYQTVRKFFMIPLGLNENSSRNQWEESLMIRLYKLNVKELFCALNLVFDVNYDRTTLFLSLSDKQVKHVITKFIKQICYRCFLTNWVVAIDDAEFIDEESWTILETILEFDNIFILVTMGQRKNLSQIASNVIENRRIRKVYLRSIDKWFHAGLACQILDVYAIPPELEKVIQTRSNGNPGWIESYLVSLIQAGGILIRKVNRKKINDFGLVAPPLYMLFRLTDTQVKEWKRIVEQGGGMHIDDWKMYIDCYKEDSDTELVYQDDLIPVCTLSPNFNVEDVDQELSMDVIILKTFDSLTSYEQLLLKSSSILGDTFPRTMLLYIMSCNSQRQAALAVQKLFEIRVLSCARGNFQNEGTSIVFKERLINPDEDRSIKCGCLGIMIEDDCQDLPAYASCGYLRFRSSMFRETTYSLLTEKQKKEFHSSAVRYLEKETRRCQSCGYGFFPFFLGARLDGNLVKLKKKKNRHTSHGVADSSLLGKYSKTKSTLSGGGNSTRSSSNLKRESGMFSQFSVPSNYNETYSPYSDPGLFGFRTIQRFKDSFSVTKTFSNLAFTNCECRLILNYVYSQLIHHYKGSGSIDEMINCMIEFASICIISYNVSQAKYILKEAVSILKAKPKDPDEPKWKEPMINGRIHMLLGQVAAANEQPQSCLNYFLEAMNLFGKPFPSTNCEIKLQILKGRLMQQIKLFLASEMLGYYKERYQADFANYLAECLAHLCKLFREQNHWQYAELAGIQSLRYYLRSGTDFRGLCIAFANMIRISFYFKKRHVCLALEVHSMRMCHRKNHNILLEEIEAVALLYYTIMYCRFARGELEYAMFVGSITTKLCATTHSIESNLKALPLLVYALIWNKQITDAVTMIYEVEHFATEDIDDSGMTWFFALCVGLQIESGYSIIPYKKSLAFYYSRGEQQRLVLRDPQAERRYFTVMWLWSVRIENWEEADIWHKKIEKYESISPNESIQNLITALYFLEGSILFLVSKHEKRNIKLVNAALDQIKKLIESLEVASKNVKCILPRFYHLKAYFKEVLSNDTKSFSILKQARKYAQQFNNILELTWIDHSYRTWHHNLTMLEATSWKEKSQVDKLMDYHEFDINGGKLALYSLAPHSSF